MHVLDTIRTIIKKATPVTIVLVLVAISIIISLLTPKRMEGFEARLDPRSEQLFKKQVREESAEVPKVEAAVEVDAVDSMYDDYSSHSEYTTL
jgi:hypothetical protein